ncbi:Spermidine/putrescine import ATP-binding protein PotA [Geodia barretti]|uniref:Spermidine/putrescine import ATP-binding protein PotA n=1 Tax=Geodia barretti TaxID=519541 RepID=A0AA35T8F9_GEOBA|nr:Spermidine/putrescine import ATP-binding protein PotA [Geodia barretti]
MASENADSVVIEGLSLAYDTTDVLKGIDLRIEPGELFTFLGPSGSGKSTLLRCVAGFGPTPRGRILIGEHEVTHLPPWRRNVGMVFQSYALWPHMTVYRNVAFGLEERRVPSAEIPRRVEAALDMVGLWELADRRPSQLSGGQQQRVALARTIIVEPRVLLLDEPLSNLDANLRVQMRREILELQRKLKLTTIFVTHDQEEANTISDRIAVLDEGILQQVGSPMDLYDSPVNRFVADFLGTANLLDGADPAMAATAFPGRVGHREFLGNLIRYTVAVDEDTSLLVDDTHQPGRRAFSVGDKVTVNVDMEHVQILSG